MADGELDIEEFRPVLQFEKQYPIFTKTTTFLEWIWLLLLVLNGWWILGAVGLVIQIYAFEFSRKMRNKLKTNEA